MERTLPLEAPDINNVQHTLSAQSGPVILSGNANEKEELRTLSIIWVNFILSRGELGLFNADPNK